MTRAVGIGHQNFEEIRREDIFYIDKTSFIMEWWENKDYVTLITRPRRFGKTLTISMTEQFFSVNYAGKKELFQGLNIWEHEKYRKLQGTYPVINISFADIKETDFIQTRKKICQTIVNIYNQYDFLLEGNLINEREKDFFRLISADMEDYVASLSLKYLSKHLYRYYGRKVLILLDEYDTPVQEAYIHGYWEKLSAFIRNLFNATFKTNPYMERAVMTGITRVSRESVFSDLNNMEVVTATSEKYADCFGFTEQEVFQALEEYGFGDRKKEVKQWYDGFTFGNHTDIYNPWSVINYLNTGKIATYWANTSSNSLVGKLIQEGSKGLKISFEKLMQGYILQTKIDEQIVYNLLDRQETAVWSLLLASGYLKVRRYELATWEYELELTNLEVKIMFQNMIQGWFGSAYSDYNDFVQALLQDNIEAMNEYMNRVAFQTFSFFDTGKKPQKRTEPERFYHGFVLGLMVELRDRYIITSNRESGFGRYDVLLEPKDFKEDGIILEFKVFQPKKEKSLKETVQAALEQIEREKYAQMLIEKGISAENIRAYGFAFEGKNVLIGGKSSCDLTKSSCNDMLNSGDVAELEDAVNNTTN